jgi:hypothetical protein
MVVAHGIFSGISGSLVSYTGHYNPVIISGAAVWTIAACAKMFYNQVTPGWVFVVVGAMEGFGIGFCFQPGKFNRVLFLGLVAGESLMAGSSPRRSYGQFSEGRPCCYDWTTKLSSRNGRCNWFNRYENFIPLSSWSCRISTNSVSI